MTLDTTKLRELATAATPGHWTVQGPWPHATIYAFDNPDLLEDVEPSHIASSPLILRSDQKCSDDADAAFIAAANPAVVLELIDDNDQLRAACATWQSIFTGFPHDAQQALRDLREKLAAITAARDELAGLARFMWTYNGQVSQAVMNDVERLAAVGKEQQ